MQSVAVHSEQTHVDRTGLLVRRLHLHSWQAALIQELQAQLAPDRSSRADQASCCTRGATL